MKNISLYFAKFKSFYFKMTVHSRFVFLLKIALPSIIALFISIFLLYPQLDESIKKVKFDIPVIDTTGDVVFNLKNTEFFGQGDDGIIFSLNISAFEENKNNTLSQFYKIKAKMFFKSNKWLEFYTDKGVYEKNNKEFVFMGNIILFDSENNKVKTDKIILNLDNMSVLSTEKIIANMFFGDIESDGFYIKKNEKIQFLGKVKSLVNVSKFNKN